MWKKFGKVGEVTDGNLIRCLRFSCWIQTHTQNISFLLFSHDNNTQKQINNTILRTVNCLNCIVYEPTNLFHKYTFKCPSGCTWNILNNSHIYQLYTYISTFVAVPFTNCKIFLFAFLFFTVSLWYPFCAAQAAGLCDRLWIRPLWLPSDVWETKRILGTAVKRLVWKCSIKSLLLYG